MNINLESKEDLMNIITSLIITQSLSFVENKELTDLIANLTTQASKVFSEEELMEWLTIK